MLLKWTAQEIQLDGPEVCNWVELKSIRIKNHIIPSEVEFDPVPLNRSINEIRRWP